MYDPSDDLFTNRAPSTLQAADLDELTTAFLDMAAVLNLMLPPSRYRSTAMSKLEECSMWAKKAVLFTRDVDH